MRFYAPDLRSDETPITTQEEYEVWLRRYQQAYERWYACFPGKPGIKEATKAKAAVEEEFRQRRLPYVLIAICPYCQQPVWQKAMVFSLQDDFWYLTYSDGRDVHPDSRCSHLFCVDGALNLTGHQPTEVQGAVFSRISGNYTLHMAAEVPFVKPRVLELPTMVAVIHALPVAGRYTAYPVVYFKEKLVLPLNSFCIPWGRLERVVHYEDYLTIGQRQDEQAYDLRDWIATGKILWVDPADEYQLLCAPTHTFPYHDQPGRRHPYTITNGVVTDRPDPIATEPVVTAESWR